MDPTGHFTCKNNSTLFEGDCNKVIETYLALLQEKGGKEGQALVDAFRKADTVDYGCGRGGCIKYKDQISITIIDSFKNENGDDTGVMAQYQGSILGDDKYVISAGMMNALGEEQLVAAGSFGHEIVHQTQGWGRGGTILAELEGYDMQWTLYKNMGIASSKNSNVQVAREIASYKYKSKEEIMDSNWAKYNYGNLPFTNIFTPKWHPSTYPHHINRRR